MPKKTRLEPTWEDIAEDIKSLYKSLSSALGSGGALTVPMMGSVMMRFKRGTDAAKARYFLPPKKKKVQKSRPVKKKINFRGLPINIEFLKGETNSGKDPDGKPWSVTYKYPYGEIDGTCTLADGEPVDVYLGPHEDAEEVYIVHQLDINGKFDEDKCFCGFLTPEFAIKAYREHGPSWGFGGIESMTWDEFVNGYLASNRKGMKKALPPPPEIVKKKGNAKVVPENVIEADIASHPSHYDKDWSEMFKKEFNVSKFDSGGRSDKKIARLFEGLKEANIPAKLWKDYKAKKEIHIEKPAKVMPTIKGYFQEHRGEIKDGRVYVFYKAFDYMDKPYRIPGVFGLAEIAVHEIGHWLFAWPLKGIEEKYVAISGWARVKDPIPEGYVQSEQNPKWMRFKSATFVDDYSAKAPNEDEAETWAWYVFRPDKLKKKCPEKFDFYMKYVGPIKNKWWKKYAR